MSKRKALWLGIGLVGALSLVGVLALPSCLEDDSPTSGSVDCDFGFGLTDNECIALTQDHGCLTRANIATCMGQQCNSCN